MTVPSKYIENNHKKKCYYIRVRRYHDMDFAVYSPTAVADEEIRVYNNEHLENETDSFRAVWRGGDKSAEPKNNEICPICKRKIQIIEDNVIGV